MIRAGWVAVAALAIALVAQLSLLNGLRLPGGAVPDLVLVLVAALAMAEGPVTGMVTGFATGLCLDLAPPGSAAVGQYALVFCLAGWAAGRLSPVATHSGRQSAGLLAAALLALVVAAAEALSAVVSLLVAPGAVSLSQLRVLLPVTIGYDLVLCPFLLYLVMVGGALLADRSAGAKRFRAVMGVGTGAATSTHALPGTERSRRAARGARLRPGSGVPGSASGLVRQRSRPAPPVHLRLAAGRRGDGIIGSGAVADRARRNRGQRGSHPGLLAGSARQFRPRPGEPGGSAVRSHTAAAWAADQRQPTIRFGGYRGDGSLGHTFTHAFTRSGAAPRRQPAIRFAGHRGDGSVGQTFGHAPTRPGPARHTRLPAIRFGEQTPGPWLRMGARRSAIAVAGTGSIPSLRFASRRAPVSRRSVAEPRFRRSSAAQLSSRLSAGVLPGGALTEAALRARRVRPTPRLRLSGGAPGMLGGTGRGPRLGRPPRRTGKQPRFSYGKRSPLSVLAGHRVGRRLGGRWLARWRVGGRSGVWLLGRRPGAAR